MRLMKLTTSNMMVESGESSSENETSSAPISSHCTGEVEAFPCCITEMSAHTDRASEANVATMT